MAEDTPAGFEYGGLFYRWNVTSTGKDLLLIDRISGMPPQEFFELLEDKHDLSRSPVMLALIATSIRARHPERSLEKIVRDVMDLSLDDIEIVGGDEDEVEESPPAEAGSTPADHSDTSPQMSNGSAEFPTSAKSSEIPRSSGSLGSDTGSPASLLTG
jgi:hypothetical protein